MKTWAWQYIRRNQWPRCAVKPPTGVGGGVGEGTLPGDADARQVALVDGRAHNAQAPGGGGGGGEEVRRGTRGPLGHYIPNYNFFGFEWSPNQKKYAEPSPKFKIRNLTRIVTIESFTRRQAEEGAAHTGRRRWRWSGSSREWRDCWLDRTRPWEPI